MMKLERWTQIAEVVTAVGAIIALVILILEVRANTAALQQQQAAQFGASFYEPYLNPEVLPGLYAKVKAVDGVDRSVQLFMDRYHMTTEEAIQWTRALGFSLVPAQNDFYLNGPSETLRAQIQVLSRTPDTELFLRNSPFVVQTAFGDYVLSIIDR
jgi:hypothetical protein